ncbi:MAG: metal-dependent transcriptional regulator [Candidatus Krumholzibacteriia bacterium]
MEAKKMATTAQLTASLEDYLEAIFHIVEDKQAARAKDIVERLGVHNSSVTQALRSLSEKGLVNYAPYDLVTLTPEGSRLARDVVKRHETLKAFLVTVLALDDASAEDGACKMEHAISGQILDRLVKFVEYFEGCPSSNVCFDEQLGYYCRRCEGAEGGERSCGREICLLQQDLREREEMI